MASSLKGHWTSLLPPLIAVVVAAFFRSLVGALVSAFALGSFLAYGLNPLATGVLALNDFLYEPVVSQFSGLIILFLFALVGMVHVMSRSGGLAGLVKAMAVFAKGRRRTKLAVGLGGLLFFFDDYSNTVVLGTTMQKLSDRWKISREKLAYLVDSTTAPVAGVALLSTWVAYEAWLVGSVSKDLGMEGSGYGLLIEMLPMRFYCIGTLIFLFLSSAMGRDFGPMLKAERRAWREGKVIADDHRTLGILPSQSIEPDEGTRPSAWNALIPIGVVVVSIVSGILLLGSHRMEQSGEVFALGSFSSWRSAFGSAVFDPGNAKGPGAMPVLLLAAVLGGLVSIALPVFQGILSLRDAGRAYVKGMPTMWMAIFILGMTWSMQAICDTLGTADYLVALLGGNMPLWLLPLLAFCVAAGMSFATGTSWGTMGILIPLILPMAAEMGATEPAYQFLYFLSAAAILDGAIFGDHCSPISDTTALSSIATGCDHIAHVSTQLYYAVSVMVLVSVFGYVAVASSLPIWTFYALYPVAVAGLLLLWGRQVDKEDGRSE